MGKKDVYRYWAVFHYALEGVSVRFPDLPGCNTSGDNAEHAYVAAKEALEGFMYTLEQDNDPLIPDPTTLDGVLKQLEPDEAVCDVQVYMPTVRDAQEPSAVNKILTIPKWLNDAAEENNINFSQVLQEALKRNLGINPNDVG
jgi:predicted RNase H-like HicB family nuclease